MVRKGFKLILGIFIPILSFFLMSQNTFAENVDTSRLQFNAMPYNSNDYNWTAELLYNQDIYGLKYARLYRFKTANFTTTGTNAVIHFETKIDYYQPQAPFKDPFVNLDYMHVQACSFNDGSNLEILGENVLYLKKYETYQGGAYGAGEITFYGDVALKGFTPNQNGYLKCMIGSFDYAFMSTGATSYNSNATSFVNNYINITMTDNVANELLAQQIAQTQQLLSAQQQIVNQNQTIINQNNQMLDNWDGEKSENQQQGQNAENASSDTQAQTTQNTQNLMDFITAFFTAFVSASATNCNLDIGLSQYGFGTIDMCSTDIPAVFSVIINIITLVMVVPMVFWLISSIISAFKEFQE